MNVDANQFILLFYTALYCSDYLLVLVLLMIVLKDDMKTAQCWTVITGTTHTQSRG